MRHLPMFLDAAVHALQEVSQMRPLGRVEPLEPWRISGLFVFAAVGRIPLVGQAKQVIGRHMKSGRKPDDQIGIGDGESAFDPA